MTLHLSTLLAYCALQVAIGLWLGRRVRTSSAFFVAGRSLGPGLLFSTLIAANIGAGSTVGAAGIGYEHGLSAWWWVGSAGIGSIVLAFVVGPRMRRVAAEWGLHTVGDYLERRYHRGVRGAVAAFLWIATIIVLSSQLVAAGKILHVVTGLPPAVGSTIGGLVATTYFTAGGLITAAWINMLQLVVELSILFLLVPASIAGAGGWDSVVAHTPAASEYWDFWHGWRYLFVLAPAFVVSPGLVQKVYGARDDRAVRLGVGMNAVLLLVFAFVPALLGMTARARHPALADPDLALPTLLASDLPPLLGAMGLAALFTTDVNTADTVLFVLSTSLSRDLYRGFVNPAATDAQVLRVARGAAVAGGALGIAFAIAVPSIVTGLTIFYSLLGVGLFVPIAAGLFTRRSGTLEAGSSMIAGVGAAVIVHVATNGRGYGVWSPPLLGLLAAAATTGVIMALRWRRASALPGVAS